MNTELSPRARAEAALTILVHETGSATICLSGITLTDLRVDLVTRLADAIAAAEDDAYEAGAAAERARLNQTAYWYDDAVKQAGTIYHGAEALRIWHATPPDRRVVIDGHPPEQAEPSDVLAMLEEIAAVASTLEGGTGHRIHRLANAALRRLRADQEQ